MRAETKKKNRMILEFSPFLTVDMRLIWDAVPVVQRSAGSCISRWQLFQCFFFSQNTVRLLLFKRTGTMFCENLEVAGFEKSLALNT